MNDQRDNEMTDLDESLKLLASNPKTTAAYEALKRNDHLWKQTDPEGYKKDMEEMCKAMFGNRWQVEYEAMLKEEFPDEA